MSGYFVPGTSPCDIAIFVDDAFYWAQGDPVFNEARKRGEPCDAIVKHALKQLELQPRAVTLDLTFASGGTCSPLSFGEGEVPVGSQKVTIILDLDHLTGFLGPTDPRYQVCLFFRTGLVVLKFHEDSSGLRDLSQQIITLMSKPPTRAPVRMEKTYTEPYTGAWLRHGTDGALETTGISEGHWLRVPTPEEEARLTELNIRYLRPRPKTEFRCHPVPYAEQVYFEPSLPALLRAEPGQGYRCLGIIHKDGLRIPSMEEHLQLQVWGVRWEGNP